MTLRNDHIRALELMSLPKGERRELPEEQSLWLEQHLADCPPCTEQMEQIELGLSQMRHDATRISARAGLVRHTQLRVRQRAYELNQQDELLQPLWVACFLALGWTAFSLPFLWEGFKWLGSSIGMPELVWQSTFVIAWLTPPSIGAAVSVRRKKQIA